MAEGQEVPARLGDLPDNHSWFGQAAPLAGDEFHLRADVARMDKYGRRREVLIGVKRAWKCLFGQAM